MLIYDWYIRQQAMQSEEGGEGRKRPSVKTSGSTLCESIKLEESEQFKIEVNEYEGGLDNYTQSSEMQPWGDNFDLNKAVCEGRQISQSSWFCEDTQSEMQANPEKLIQSDAKSIMSQKRQKNRLGQEHDSQKSNRGEYGNNAYYQVPEHSLSPSNPTAKLTITDTIKKETFKDKSRLPEPVTQALTTTIDIDKEPIAPTRTYKPKPSK